MSELLKDNLYEYQKWIKETGGEPYFTLPNLRRIMVQCLEALAFIHSLKLIHCDIKVGETGGAAARAPPADRQMGAFSP